MLYTQEQPKLASALKPATLLVISIFLLTACASSPTTEIESEASEVDPYENFNRNIYEFNSVVNNYVASPITQVYKFLTPNLLQTGISNFFTNLSNVSVVFNDILQGKAQQGAEDTRRFLINSILGILGIFDVASEIGLPQNQEDFAQTLAVWGVPTGPYIVLPFFGPTTFRGMPGAAVDLATNPITYIGIPAIQTTSIINSRASADDLLQFIDEAALDPYIFTREAYLQWRQHLATDGIKDNDEDPFADYEDDLFADEEMPGSQN